MKKLLTLFLFIGLTSCEMKPVPAPESISTKEIRSTNNDEIDIIIVDGCEYITWRRYEGSYNSYSSGIVHKGNCRNHTN